jgi:ATP-binding cassette subfamily B protein
VSLASFGALLLTFSPWAVLLLVAAGLPGFVAETKFSNDAFRLFRWRSSERRMQAYLETVIAREDHAKEVKLFDLGALFLGRYKAIFEGLYEKDRNLTVRRETWVFLLTLLSISSLYAAYAWCAVEAVCGLITLGAMTMYIMLFRQGQAAVTASLGAIGGMYEDNLYLSTLYEYLEQPVDEVKGTAVSGPDPEAGVQFENVEFRYPGSNVAAVTGINLHMRGLQRAFEYDIRSDREGEMGVRTGASLMDDGIELFAAESTGAHLLTFTRVTAEEARAIRARHK